MAAIRMLFSWLTEKGVFAMNPAREVKTRNFPEPRQNPAFDTEQVQKFLEKIETSNEVGLRDRALSEFLPTFLRLRSPKKIKS